MRVRGARFPRLRVATASLVAGLAARTLAVVLPQDLRYETVDGLQWSYVIEDGRAKVTNRSMEPAIDSSTRGAIVVPDSLGGCPVTAVGAYAFYQVTGITSLTIPEGVEEIEYNACRGCTNLESVSLPSTLTTMGDAVFFNCQSLKAGLIPDGVTSMGRDTFWGCLSMTSVKFSENVALLGTMTCYNCDSLTNVVIPDSVRDIGISAFLNCGNLISVSIPNTVTNIGNDAFDNCASLEAVDLPEDLLALNQSFSGCTSLTTIRVPPNVAAIAPRAFSGCSAMTSIEVDPANASFKSVDGILYDITGETLLAWPHGRAPVVIPEGVKRIGEAVFATRRDITSVVFPDGLETIGASAFEACSQLRTAAFPSSLKAIGGRAFYNCTSLTSATFAEAFETVGEKAFGNSGVQSLVFPESTKRICKNAFFGCSQLQSLEMKSQVCGIEECAFDNCPSLTSVSIADGANVSPFAFGYPATPPSIDGQDVLWACDFNAGRWHKDVESDYYADGHVVRVGGRTSAEINFDKTAGRTNALIWARGGSVWFSANKVSGDHVGDYVVPDEGQTVTLSFLLSSITLSGSADTSGMEFPKTADTSEPHPDALKGPQDTMIAVDDKIFLRCCEDAESDHGFCWQVKAAAHDREEMHFERIVASDSADDQDFPDFTKEWGEIKIEAANDGSGDGLAFRIFIGGILAESEETGETVFRADSSAEEMEGVSAVGFGGTAAVDDIVFRLDEGDPLADVNVQISSGRLTEGEKQTLAGIVGRDALRGMSDLWLGSAKGEPDDAPLTCVQLGISPVSIKTSKSQLSLYFKNPTVAITGFAPVGRVVTGRIIPAEGTKVVQPPMKYMFGLTQLVQFGTSGQYAREYGDSFSRNTEGFVVDLSDYVTSNGVFSLAFPPMLVKEDSAFFSVTIKPYAGRANTD